MAPDWTNGKEIHVSLQLKRPHGDFMNYFKCPPTNITPIKWQWDIVSHNKKINCLKLNSFNLNLDWTYGADKKVSLNFAYSLIYLSAPLIVWNEQSLGVFDVWAQQIDDNLLLALIC